MAGMDKESKKRVSRKPADPDADIVYSWLFFFIHRQVVRVNMTVKATGEPLVQAFAMRFAVAVLAPRDLAVGGMAGGALQWAMLGHICTQVIVNAVVACAAGSVWNIFRILFDVRCTMRRMALEAVLIHLVLDMRLVTVETARDGSVHFRVAPLAVHLRVMLAGELVKLCPLVVMAHPADHLGLFAFRCHGLLQIGELDNLRRMRLLMALHAGREIRSVRQLMTPLALGHDSVPVVLSRVVGMELFVTGRAIHLMLAALVLEPLELIVVTAAAFFRGQRFDVHLVEFRISGRSFHFFLAACLVCWRAGNKN